MSTASHFILAMVLYPEVLAKAQEEIDTVVGNSRLPTFADRSSLPYIECIMSECLRWAVPVPMSETVIQFSAYRHRLKFITDLPHVLMQDDTYRGMHIPKGTFVSFDCVVCPNHCLDLDMIPGRCKYLVRQSSAVADSIET
jgi:Cytochrome P450